VSFRFRRQFPIFSEGIMASSFWLADRNRSDLADRVPPAVARLIERLAPSREALVRHPIYNEVLDHHDVHRFMKYHIYAVYDFMSKLKALQIHLTSVALPWLPTRDRALRRLINDIVKSEETDEDGRGGYSSHFELYLESMEQCGADTGPIETFVARLRSGEDVRSALGDPSVPEGARRFCLETLDLIDMGLISVAAAFTFGREDVVPEMFQQILDRLQPGGPPGADRYDRFRYYLSRHIALDADEHGPMAFEMIDRLCAGDEHRLREAELAARHALEARCHLWDAAVEDIRAGRERGGGRLWWRHSVVPLPAGSRHGDDRNSGNGHGLDQSNGPVLVAAAPDAPAAGATTDRSVGSGAHAPLLWRNGRLVSWSEATVHVTAVGHASVSSSFEGIRAYAGADGELYVFRLGGHLARLAASSRISRLDCPYSPGELSNACVALLRAINARVDTYLRPWVFARDLVREHIVPAGTPVECVIDTWPMPSHLGRLRSCRVCVSSWSRPGDNSMPPRAKTFANYHNGRLGTVEARANGHDWPIFLNDRGMVAEGPGACVALVRNGRLVTPSLSCGVLESLTRDTLLRLAAGERGLSVEERDVQRTELYLADELFFLGTGWEVLPITEIDGLPVGTGDVGPVTTELAQLYHDVVRGLLPRYSHWLTPVWRT
jgi:branched-chain amino acid aminotransferase